MKHFLYIIICSFYIVAPLSVCGESVAGDALRHLVREIGKLIVKSKVEEGVMIIKPRSTRNYWDWELMTSTEFKLWEYVKPLSQVEYFQWIGPLIFLFGFIHQLRTHLFGVTRPGWFRYMDHPIVIYFGILLASGASDVTAWFLFAFVIIATAPTVNKRLCLSI